MYCFWPRHHFDHPGEIDLSSKYLVQKCGRTTYSLWSLSKYLWKLLYASRVHLLHPRDRLCFWAGCIYSKFSKLRLLSSWLRLLSRLHFYFFNHCLLHKKYVSFLETTFLSGLWIWFTFFGPDRFELDTCYWLLLPSLCLINPGTQPEQSQEKRVHNWPRMTLFYGGLASSHAQRAHKRTLLVLSCFLCCFSAPF